MLEILMIYPAIALVLIPIFRLQGAVHGYSEAKEYVFICLSALAFIGLLFTGIPVLKSNMDWFFLAFILYITLSVYWSDAPSLAVKDVPRWWAIFLLYLVCSNVPCETLMLAVFMPAPLISAYGMYQQIRKRDPLDHWVHDMLRTNAKGLRFYSFLGNSNYTGSYLVGAIFAGIYCVANISLWFAPFLMLVIVGIALTRARGAWVAVIVGFLGVMPEMWPYMVPMFIAIGVISWRRFNTAKTRVHFLNTGWTMFKERFLFGWGPNAFRRKIFKTQAYMNQMNPRILGTLKKRPLIDTPLARRMHNDHAEMFVEYGLIGASLWFAVIGLGLFQAFTSGQWYIVGGILAISINALFFYPVRVIGIGIGLWAFLGASGSQNMAQVQFTHLPLYLSLPIALIVCMVAWEFAIKRLMAISHMFHYNLAQIAQDRPGGETHLRAAMEFDPLNGHIMAEFASFYANASPPLSMSTVLRSIELYDGEKIEWSLWVQMGTTAVLNGAADFARVCFRMAIYLNPSYKRAYECIDELDKMLKNLQEVPPGEMPAGFKKEGNVIVPDKRIEVVRS